MNTLPLFPPAGKWAQLGAHLFPGHLTHYQRQFTLDTRALYGNPACPRGGVS